MPPKIKEYIGTIRLGHQRGLIIGNLHPDLPFKAVCEQPNHLVDTVHNGFFESAAPNFATYYPEVTAEDLAPQDADYVYPVFRGLSEVVVHKNWNPIDFSEDNVLKNSMHMLVGQTLYPNHEMIIGNELGVVYEVEWQNSYKTEKGIIVPAGINARLKIDGKSNPKVARGVMGNPPAIHSTSVTVTFAWKKSHDSLADEEFYRKLGTFDEKGVMYRRIATKILSYSEISLVPHGADPYAKKVDASGKIVLPEHAARRDGKISNGELPTSYYFSFNDLEDSTQLNEENTIPIVTNNNEETQQNKKHIMNREFLLNLAFSLGIADTENLSDDDLKSQVKTSLKDATTKVKSLGEEVEALKKASLTDEQRKQIDDGVAFRAKLVDEATRTYKLAYTDKADASVLAAFATKPLTELEANIKEYSQKLEETTPLTCQDCRSVNISRQAASASPDSGGKDKPFKVKSAEEAFTETLAEATKASSERRTPMFEEVESK
jgi:hypothetical protein